MVHSLFLALHIISGFTALTSGIIPMIAQKGGRVHNLAGRVYFWGMAGVFLTTIALFTLNPLSLMMQFLLPVGIASFYQTFTGKRILLRKKTSDKPGPADWVFLWCIGLFGFVTITWTVQRLMAGDYFMATLFGFLTVLCVGSAWADYRAFTRKVPAEKMYWFYTHLSRMLASYTATLTAFLVTAVPRMLPASLPSFVNILLWVGPGTLAGILIPRCVRYYRRKFQKPAVTA